MSDYVLEMLVGEQAYGLPSTEKGTNLEIVIEDVAVTQNAVGSALLEVYETLPDTHYYIGPTPPTDPGVLVWYDTSQPV